jgi:hypothetical protein
MTEGSASASGLPVPGPIGRSVRVVFGLGALYLAAAFALQSEDLLSTSLPPQLGWWVAFALGAWVRPPGRGLRPEAVDVDVVESGVPERTRTSDLQVRNLTLYPLSYGHATAICGGEGGIRTLGRGNPLQRFSKPPH